jgi:zinc protease
MKNILLTIIASLILVSAYAQIDRSQRPEPGPAPRIEIGKAQSFTLSNGLQVFVVENSKVPRITFSMVFDYDPVYEGQIAGLVDITGAMIRTATENRTKEMIDDEIDFIGASMSASARGLYASGLSRHTSTLTELIADVVVNARFEQEHFDRAKTQARSGLSAAKNDPASIASRVNKVLIYGADHPYGVNTTEESLDNITIDMCREFYQSFVKPEITYLAVVGDVKFEEIKALLEKHFASWERGMLRQQSYPTPQLPEGRRVAIVDRPNAVQSAIRVGFPVDLKPGAEDAISARVMNNILGGGTSRLFDNLRETHGFTYGAYSRLNTDKLMGAFVASTDVRNIATDSAVYEILFEINRLRYEAVPDEELQLYKNEQNGNFALSLENPQTVANFALNIARYDLPGDYYATYLQKLADITAEDIMEAANKYLYPDYANILIVGKAADVAESMKKFADDGQIHYYDEDGNKYDPGQKLKPAPEGMTAAAVTAKYIEAIGGEKKLKKIKDLNVTATAEMQGMTLTFDTYQKAPDKMRVEIGSGGTVFSEQIYDGEQGMASSPMGKEKLEGEMLEEMKFQAAMNIELYYDEYGIKQELLGIETVNGKEAYKLQLSYPTGNDKTEYYDTETRLKIKSISTAGIAEYDDYREVDGIQFPFAIRQTAGPQVIDLKVIAVKINSKLKDDLFKIE